MMTNEKDKSEMAGRNRGAFVHCMRTRSYYYRKCKGKLLTNIDSLPDEIVFDILVKLPAQHIYDVTRFVCSKWYKMIRSHRFIYDHLKSSTTGILIQQHLTQSNVYFLSMQQGGSDCIEISEMSYLFGYSVWSSCHGLVLMSLPEKYPSSVLYISNPATKQHFGLPPFPGRKRYPGFSGLAYAVDSMEYKVVSTNKIVNYKDGDDITTCECDILTVGVDKSWRQVPAGHLPMTAKKAFSCNSYPLVAGGFMYWSACLGSDVVAFNVETETFTHIKVPQCCENKPKKFLSTGKVLYFMTKTRSTDFSWMIWEMGSEFQWTKMPNIDLEAHKCWIIEQFFTKEHCYLRLIGWLKYKEVMLFKVVYTHLHLAYYVRTQEIRCIEKLNITPYQGPYFHCIHLNSLVRLS